MPADLEASAIQLKARHTRSLLIAFFATCLLVPPSLRSGMRSMASLADAATVPKRAAFLSMTNQFISDAPIGKIKFWGVLPPE
ncbi:ORF1242 [White spot syndrome virus]|uniref:Wsv038 n=3 Tax=White spot syndrome virus TaxID=342409 RepID=Q8VBC8_WSSVS|nr:wsv038 [Shrimp white spot syndrome virus]AFX59415.1 wsv038 [White spot syndrome virus]AAL33042.1 wsv038 [Shrimp white spot syndrome virus]AAL88963.1 WSSV095 [Shrimp white spot syndrome virus]ATU83808.1 ORF1242 [White spot syndrome virus]AWQ60227.1 wsv038 [Shrimp white spot syndrome virus]